MKWAALVVLIGVSARGATYHVSASGTIEGDGSEGRPWSLPTALAQPAAVKPGDTLLLHAGTYAGTFTSRLTGTADAPITLKAIPGERATIDCLPPKDKPEQACHFTVQGAHAIYQSFEVTCSLPGPRDTATAGSHPGGASNRGGVNCSGAHVKFINLVVHDTSQGFGFWSNGEGGEIYGCIIYNNGWIGPDRGHGHAIYTQNKTGVKRLVDNIMFAQFSYGIHAYGSKAAFLLGYHIEGNVAFLNGAPAGKNSRTPGILVGGGSPADNITVINNFTWADRNHGTVQMGYSALNKKGIVKDNYFTGGMSLGKWDGLTNENNTIIRRDNLPKEAKVFLRPNTYEKGRAHIIVYNWPSQPAVSVDVKDILKPGQPYVIKDAQDFYGQPIGNGMFDGKPISIEMKPRPAPVPTGMDQTPTPPSGPEFGVFVLMGQ